jgi:mycothiol synthase
VGLGNRRPAIHPEPTCWKADRQKNQSETIAHEVACPIMNQGLHSVEAVVDYRSLSDSTIAELNTFSNELRRELNPSDPLVPLAVSVASVRNLPPQVELRAWIVRDQEKMIGYGEASWDRVAPDNKHVLDSRIQVLAGARRSGIGRLLLEKLLEVSQEQQRPMLLGFSDDAIEAAAAFAERFGAKHGQSQRVSRLLLDDLDTQLIEKWTTEGPARAPGYELVFVDGRIPDEMMDEAIRAFSIMNTAPRDGLDIEDWELTPEHVRAWETQREAEGGILWTLFAKHQATGRLVGFTEIGWNPQVPGLVRQMGTAVDPEHRGRALGKWLKADMIRRLLTVEDFKPVEIRTGNAESNAAMLGINVAMGFKPWRSSSAWQLDAEVARQRLSNR